MNDSQAAASSHCCMCVARRCLSSDLPCEGERTASLGMEQKQWGRPSSAPSIVYRVPQRLRPQASAGVLGTSTYTSALVAEPPYGAGVHWIGVLSKCALTTAKQTCLSGVCKTMLLLYMLRHIIPRAMLSMRPPCFRTQGARANLRHSSERLMVLRFNIHTHPVQGTVSGGDDPYWGWGVGGRGGLKVSLTFLGPFVNCNFLPSKFFLP